jgi:nucleoside-diphosphate-sugar epimerase
VGEYAMSCLGRERMFDYYAHNAGTKVLHFRLNYAVELRYGVLHDMAAKVWNNQPVDLAAGHANVIWQGYANSVAIRALTLASVPPHILNVTGPETLSIRQVAEHMGRLMGKTPIFTSEESPNALLSNATQCHNLFGYPPITLDTLIEWTAHWVMNNRETLNKPTHFEVRNGRF